MVRSPSTQDSDLKKGPWTPEEDEKLVDYINTHGHGSWRALPKLAGLNRCGKSCRLRWKNYLRPDIKRGKFSEEEERVIINLHSVLGNKWSMIATHLPGRTDNEIKNYWNTHIRKKLLQMGIDPKTHKPRTDFHNLLGLPQLLGAAQFGNLINTWNSVKLQADATQLAKIQLVQILLQIMNTSRIPRIDNLGLLGSQNLCPFKGTSTSEDILSPSAMIFQAPNYFQDINNSLGWNEGGVGQGGVLHVNNSNSLSSSYDIQTENQLPELVSTVASPETSIVNQMESKANPSSSTASPAFAVFEEWEKLMNEETSGSCWKDILDLASSSEHPTWW